MTQTRTAWDLIGFDGGVRLVNGHTVYDQVFYDDSRGGRLVRLDRLVATPAGLRIINRYVDPDTLLVVVEEGAS